MKVVISGSDIAAILTAVGTILATVFAFINVMMTNRQNKIMAERDAKRDQQNHDVKQAIVETTQTLKSLDITGQTGSNRAIEHEND